MIASLSGGLEQRRGIMLRTASSGLHPTLQQAICECLHTHTHTVTHTVTDTHHAALHLLSYHIVSLNHSMSLYGCVCVSECVCVWGGGYTVCVIR